MTYPLSAEGEILPSIPDIVRILLFIGIIGYIIIDYIIAQRGEKHVLSR